MQIFFPNIATYAIIIVITNIIFLYTIFNKKSTTVNKLINVPFFITIMVLMVYTIELVSKKKINIYIQKQVYANEKIVTIIQSTTLIFTLWIIILLSKYILTKLIKKSDEKVRNESIIPNNEKNPNLPEIKIKKTHNITQPNPAPIAVINPINPVNPAPNMAIPITTPNQVSNTGAIPVKVNNTTTYTPNKETGTTQANNNLTPNTIKQIPNTAAIPIKINNINPVFSTAPTFATIPNKTNNTNIIPAKINNVNPVPSTAPTIIPNTVNNNIKTNNNSTLNATPTINQPAYPKTNNINPITNNTIPTINTNTRAIPNKTNNIPNTMNNTPLTNNVPNNIPINNQTSLFNTLPNQNINKQKTNNIEQLKI